MIGSSTVEPLALPIETALRVEDCGAPAGDRIVDIRSGALQVRLAETTADIDAAQALRYRIFYEKLGAHPLPEMARRRRDFDRFDADCDHLLVLDHSRGSGVDPIVGTYRLIR